MTTQSLIQRKNYWSLDVAKFFCAILIISAHFAAEWGNFPTLIDYAFSIYIIGVPFFFACSGFLFFEKIDSLRSNEEKRTYFINYEKRIWIMYGIWSVIYVVFQVYVWFRKGEFSLDVVLEWLHTALVIQTYATIWFLPALAVGIAITYFLVTKFSKNQVIIIAIILYILGMFGYTYKFLVEGTPIGSVYDLYIDIFVTSRNGLFNAVPYICMGCIISRKKIIASTKGFVKNSIFAGISFVLMIVESFILKLKFNVTGMDFCIFVAVFTYFFISALINFEIKEIKLWVWMRKLSILIFVCQMLFLTVLPFLLPTIFNKLYANSYIGLVLVLGMTIVFSIILILLSNKIKFLKRMY